MPTFCLLRDPTGYVPCSTENMLVDGEYREYWLGHFESHFSVLMAHAADTYGAGSKERIAACVKDFVGMLNAVRAKPDMFGTLDLLVLDVERQKKLIAHGLPDPFEKMKRRENEAMLGVYPQVVADLDRHTSEEEGLKLAIEGVFAGNIFDLGAKATAKMFASESPDFIKVRDGLDGKRPWLVDDFDAMAERILRGPKHKKAVFLCDNAGSDCVLGVIPFCRLLAKRGTKVLIAANDLPALNDMTYGELVEFLPRLQKIDPVLDGLVKSGKLGVVNSGGDAPLIDLRRVSREMNEACCDADLLFIEGMGRAIESNFEALFTVDTVKLAMIKEEIVAKKHGGKLFDTVCRFDAAGREGTGCGP